MENLFNKEENIYLINNKVVVNNNLGSKLEKWKKLQQYTKNENIENVSDLIAGQIRCMVDEGKIYIKPTKNVIFFNMNSKVELVHNILIDIKERINNKLYENKLQVTYINANEYDYYDDKLSCHSLSYFCCIFFPCVHYSSLSQVKKNGIEYKFEVHIDSI